MAETNIKLAGQIYPVILSGGAGTRLWPLSTEECPKQFLGFGTNRPLIVETAQRFEGAEFAAPTVVSGRDYRFLVAQAFHDAKLTARQILLEPMGKNTAPSLVVAALSIFKENKDGVLVSVPSDHLIKNKPAFLEAVAKGIMAAHAGHVVTFGIMPDFPNTNYGYIKQSSSTVLNGLASEIDRFVEKPELDVAEKMLAEGGYFWNAGIFMAKASILLEEYKKHAPDLLALAKDSLDAARQDIDFTRLDKAAFEKIPSVPFDVAIMEKTKIGCVIPVDMDWSDIGSWDAVYEEIAKDDAENATYGDAELISTTNSLVWSEPRIKTSVVGLDDVMVVSTRDHVLVSAKNQSAAVGKLAKRLQAEQGANQLTSAKYYRPWGYYQTVDHDPNYQVKRLVLRSGARLSLQYHHHRSEHWVVVAGTATVTKGDETFDLLVNESIYIPVGVQHRLENRQDHPLVLIEVQSGDEIREDDIIRLSDDWGRIEEGEVK